MLARSHAANKSIVVVTDGEPTAHFENGQIEFSYPPTRQTIRETLKEVGRCTRDGITINTFMLEQSRPLADFVDRMTGSTAAAPSTPTRTSWRIRARRLREPPPAPRLTGSQYPAAGLFRVTRVFEPGRGMQYARSSPISSPNRVAREFLTE